MWEYFVFLVNKNFFFNVRIFFFSERSFDVKAPFYMWMRWYLFRFVIIIHWKKCYFVLKRSFVWLKKIVFDESFYKIVLLLIQFFSCTWLLLFLQEGCGANVQISCLIWGFFLFIWWFFLMLWWNTITVLFPLFFCKIFVSCFFKKKRKVFFLLICKKKVLWMNWIVCWLSCRRICFFFSDSNFFEWNLKKLLYERSFLCFFFHLS